MMLQYSAADSNVRLNFHCRVFFFHRIILELTKDTFIVGRATSCDYSLQAPKIKQKLLVQMSKRHFQITRDLSDVESPVYIEVIHKLIEFDCVN